MGQVYPACVLCGKPVIKHEEQYEVYEKMHWLCFHIMFEHNDDVDVACNAGGCPWHMIEVYEDALRKCGQDPTDIYASALARIYKSMRT